MSDERHSIPHRFLAAVADRGGRPAVADGTDKPWTFAELAGRAQAVAEMLDRADAGPRTAVALPAGPWFAASFLGIHLSGRTPVPLNFLLGPRELGAVLADAGADRILSGGELADALAPLAAAGGPPVVRLDRPDDADLRAPESAPSPPDVNPAEDLGVLLYTSGTTGQPKGVMLSHRNLVSNVDAVLGRIDYDPDNDVMLAALPTFHIFALTVNMLLPALAGTSAAYVPRFHPKAIVATAAAHRATVMPLVPSMFRLVARGLAADEAAKGALRLPIAGGEPLPRPVDDAFQAAVGVPLYEGYGMTETSPVIAVNVPEANRPGTVGRPLDGLEVRIADENDSAVGEGEDGEIQVRGPSVMLGYHGRPEETAAVMTDDGYMKTGDIGRLEDGFLRITGRAKEMLIVAGENVFPAEIEAHLLQVEGVAEAAVVGRPSEKHGEVPVAFVIAAEGADAPDTDAILAALREELAPYKVPREVRVVDDMPRAPTGKILKRALHELL